MAKQNHLLKGLISFLAWLTGIIVCLAVSIALINGTLVVPFLGPLNEVAGWIAFFTTLLTIILGAIHKFG